MKKTFSLLLFLFLFSSPLLFSEIYEANFQYTKSENDKTMIEDICTYTIDFEKQHYINPNWVVPFEILSKEISTEEDTITYEIALKNDKNELTGIYSIIKLNTKQMKIMMVLKSDNEPSFTRFGYYSSL